MNIYTSEISYWISILMSWTGLIGVLLLIMRETLSLVHMCLREVFESESLKDNYLVNIFNRRVYLFKTSYGYNFKKYALLSLPAVTLHLFLYYMAFNGILVRGSFNLVIQLVLIAALVYESVILSGRVLGQSKLEKIFFSNVSKVDVWLLAVLLLLLTMSNINQGILLTLLRG